METLYYYPGCSLTNKAKSFNETAKDCLKVLGFELTEIPNWYCCQANYSMVTDNLMNHLASVRTLVAARKISEQLVVLCSTCYYTLKRVNHLMQQDEEKRKIVLEFIEEKEYPLLKVMHLLEFFRDQIGFEAIKKKVTVNLKGIKVAAYYGCQLLRPAQELSFDNPESPKILEDFLEAIGLTPVDYPLKIECCGSYLVTAFEDTARNCVASILESARKNSAEAIVTSCPLCHFNLDWFQLQLKERVEVFKPLPVFYLTELLSLALRMPLKKEMLREHYVDVTGFLKEKGLA